MSKEKQAVWERDLMPGKDVVLDFYASELPGQPERQEQAEWERIDDYYMDSSVPGYPKLAPHQQWHVTVGKQQWMIYQWWSGTGYDDDEYLYHEMAIEEGKK